MQQLKLYNTASRTKETFRPLEGRKVGLYTCGPTVYNYAHIGNLRTYVFEDLLKRTLRISGYDVNHVCNITDVGHLVSDADDGEDKMQKGAEREGRSVWDIAEHYTEAFKSDISKLNILEPGVWCRATEHIKEQIGLVATLEKKGFTYKAEDGIYFDTSKFPDYSKFAGLDLENIKAGARVKMTAGKKSPTDFALWKFSPEKGPQRAMEWDSPWGKGFPGWHIECSAMAMKYLGETFDIHCGGIDHVPVHHTNEIAQAEAATGKKFANFWLHGEFLILDKGKMSKSGEDFLTLNVLEQKGYNPLAYRYVLLMAHYRSPLKFSFEAMEAAAHGYSSLLEKASEACRCKKPPDPAKADEYRNRFYDSINDDLNTPKALAVLQAALKDHELGGDACRAFISEVDNVLGLGLDAVLTTREETPTEINDLLEKRKTARERKDFAEADAIRDRLKDLGVIIKDTPEGVIWHKI
ncbi:MAG: cysteine--tRNA ligase [Fibrobacterota bacterium]